jgi:hypothetical protein
LVLFGGVTALLLQLIELLTTFVEKAQFKSAVQAALKEMMYVGIAYLQMTQVRTRNTSWQSCCRAQRAARWVGICQVRCPTPRKFGLITTSIKWADPGVL